MFCCPERRYSNASLVASTRAEKVRTYLVDGKVGRKASDSKMGHEAVA